MPDVPIATAKCLPANVLFGNPISFTVPLAADIACAGNQVYIPLGHTVPVAPATCEALRGLHAHSLNHPILDPQYFDEPVQVNRVYVIGVDGDGNMVYGEAKDNTINGEVLLTYPDSMITTRAMAEIVATNILAKARLSDPRGQIRIPVHCGLELWDVVKINDTYCDQDNTLFRVSGWTTTYQAFIPGRQEAKYEQIVRLTAV